jgi:hypothetical protein
MDWSAKVMLGEADANGDARAGPNEPASAFLYLALPLPYNLPNSI